MFINTPFILASTSRSRISILKKLNIDFVNIKPECDESYFKKRFIKLKYSSEKISLELSKLKAKSISSKIKNKLVIGSDTIIDCDGKTIGKANNIKDARLRIKKLSGKKHIIISSIAAYHNKKLIWHKSEKTTVKLRKLNMQQINKYLNICGPSVFDSVGVYQIEEKGPIIIENIEGDFFNVMGFPLFSFLKFLIKFNSKKT